MTVVKPAQKVFFNGPIYTVDSTFPKVEAVSVCGEKISAVGSWAEIQKQIGPNTEVVDLKGRMLIPGFIESHGHLQGMGRMAEILNVQGKSVTEIQQLVKKRSLELKSGTWILGRGWDQHLWPQNSLPLSSWLDEVSSQHPVYLTRIDGHAAWINSLAWSLVVEDRKKRGLGLELPLGGQISVDKNGDFSGVLIDTTMEWATQIIPPYSFEQMLVHLENAQKECLSLGITSFHDAGSDSDILPVYDEWKKSGKQKLRLYVMLLGSNQDLCRSFYKHGPKIDSLLTIRAIKLYADGALGSCGALLFAPYSHAQDLRDPHGLMLLSEEQVYAQTKEAMRAGFQVCTHAIGDKANHLVLNAYERSLKEHPPGDYRLRVEHAQLLHPHDVPRFQKLAVIASMQAQHCTSDMLWIEDTIGQERAQTEGYLWQSLLKNKTQLCNGSDVPIEHASPLWGFYSSITRQTHDCRPKGGWVPEERMSRAEALYSFTQAGAFASFCENQLGSITPGKFADLVILDRDIMTVPALEVLSTHVSATMIGGEWVYFASTT